MVTGAAQWEASKFFIIKEKCLYMEEKTLEHLLSLHILNDLKLKNLITDKEFEAIALENKKSFQVAGNPAINLINPEHNYIMCAQ